MSKSSTFEEHIKETMQWHFSSETGSPFWLSKLTSLAFDPRRDIRSLHDLRLFDDISDELRSVPVQDLMPRGLAGHMVAGVFESGGTTGLPKRVVVYQEWLNQLVSWRLNDSKISRDSHSNDTLALIPSGPHVVGAINKVRAAELNGQIFMIDLDPRWVKRLIAAGDSEAAQAYSEHILDQAETIVSTQSIAYLIATPPLLARFSSRPNLVHKLRRTLRMIIWGGTQIDIDTLDYLKTVVFPGIEFSASYGNTMALGEAKARQGDDFKGAPIFDTFYPYITLEVIDEESGHPVEFQSRGRVLCHHLSKYAFIPNILERDTAIRLKSPDGRAGVSVCDIRSIGKVAGMAVIEGVY